MLQMSNLWFNINGYKDYNNLHDHQNSILSGAFYIDVEEPDLMGNIEFHREDAAIHFYHHLTSTIILQVRKHLIDQKQDCCYYFLVGLNIM